MEIRKCKSKKCQRPLSGEYKHEYCENCRNEQVKRIKSSGKVIAGVAVFVVGTVLSIVSKGKINTKK